MIPEMSSGNTSNSTSSMNFLVMVNLNKHFLVTCKFALLTIQPKGYGLWWGTVSRLSFLTKSSEIKFDYDPLSNNASIFVWFEITLTWNNSILDSSFGVLLWLYEELVLPIVSFPFVTVGWFNGMLNPLSF